MAIFDTVSIRGLRETHFRQLYSLLRDREEEGSYYGNKKQYWRRHEELKEWLQEIMEYAAQPGVNIPRLNIKNNIDDHLGCPAYPNCDINPLGCRVASGEDVEWFGHRD